MTLTIDLHSSCVRAGALLTDACQHVAESRAFRDKAVAESQAARRDLATATVDQDLAKAHDAANRLREAELIASATEEPQTDRATITATLDAIADVCRVFMTQAVKDDGYVEDRSRLAREWKFLDQRTLAWSRNGADATEGLALLTEASSFAAKTDAYLAQHPTPARRADHLVHDETPRTWRPFQPTDMNARHSA